MGMKKQKTTMGERIRTLRDAYKHRGLTAKMISDYLGISPMQLNHFENDKRVPYFDNLKKMTTLLGTTMEWIDKGEGEMLPHGEADISLAFFKQDESFWKEEAYTEVKSQRDKLEAKYNELMALFNNTVAAFNMKMGKLKGLNSTGPRHFKKRRLLRPNYANAA
jgi:transcriptional regulator with XRE-family HTH domain